MHDHPQLRDARWADDLTSLCLDSPVEPFLSNSVEPIFYDVVMILMESVSDHFRGLRVVAARYTEAYLSLIISLHFQFDIQSHHVSFLFGVQIRIFILAFRVIIASQF